MAHPVSTREFDRLVNWEFIVHADKAVDPEYVSM